MVLDHGIVEHVRELFILDYVDDLVLNDRRDDASEERHDHVNDLSDKAPADIELHVLGVDS